MNNYYFHVFIYPALIFVLPIVLLGLSIVTFTYFKAAKRDKYFYIIPVTIFIVFVLSLLWSLTSGL
ncbi:MAG: hypothetical protein JWN12_868 [Candidatus Saccharibacteria bacterium]|nr:hypothetical protein [Candidatus Saccharibacteria bacterium]